MLHKLKMTSLVALALAGAAACGADGESGAAAPLGRADSGATVEFVTPLDGDTVSSPVQIEMLATDYDIEPAGEVVEGSGHFHVMVDTECVGEGVAIPSDDNHNHFGKAQTETELELAPGEHTLCLQVGDGVHTATSLTDTITITVE